jgi:hypothetical protein
MHSEAAFYVTIETLLYYEYYEYFITHATFTLKSPHNCSFCLLSPPRPRGGIASRKKAYFNIVLLGFFKNRFENVKKS